MGKLNTNNLLLYFSYTLTCLEDRAWSFAVSLAMQQLGGMRLVSIEQFTEGIAQMLFSGSLGKYFDDCTRRKGITLIVPVNNFSLMAACACFVTCLSVNEGTDHALYTALLTLGMLFCACNRLALNGEKNLLGRDWVVVMGKQGDLSKLNAILTSLDQLANVISPLVTGGLVTLCGLRTTAIVFGAASSVSIVLKAVILNRLLNSEPRLNEKEKKEEEIKSTAPAKSNALLDAFKVLVVYYRQRIFPAALGMALLFMTVLGFDGLAIGYGQSVGLPDSLLGGFRSYGSAMGIAGAISYAFFERMMGVRKTGVFGLAFQQVFLLLAIGSIWMPGSPMDLGGYFGSLTANKWWSDFKGSFEPAVTTIAPPNSTESGIDWKNFKSDGHSMISIFAFMIGIATARFGLWMADLSITHVMQEGVFESERNTVFGVHNALCQTFSVLKDVMVIVLPEASTFAICMLISYGFVFVGFVAYLYYLSKTRASVGDTPLPPPITQEEIVKRRSTDDMKQAFL